MYQITSKAPVNTEPPTPSSWEMPLSPWSFLPGDAVTENLFAVCLSPPTCPAGGIVAVYVVCWMPYHARRLMYCYVPDDAWTE